MRHKMLWCLGENSHWWSIGYLAPSIGVGITFGWSGDFTLHVSLPFLDITVGYER